MRLFAVIAAVLALAGVAHADALDDAAAAAYRGDYATMAKILRPLADQGVAAAQNNLGALYARGMGVKKDVAEATRLYLAAAEQGLAEGQNNIGYQYETGIGVQMDINTALMWYRRAAEQGHAGAELSLGLLFWNGNGVPKDAVTAFMWFSMSSAHGSANARQAMSQIIPSMTPEQAAEGRQRQIEMHAAAKSPAAK